MCRKSDIRLMYKIIVFFYLLLYLFYLLSPELRERYLNEEAVKKV